MFGGKQKHKNWRAFETVGRRWRSDVSAEEIEQVMASSPVADQLLINQTI